MKERKSSFKEKLLRMEASDPHAQTLSHIILMDKILQNNPGINFDSFTFDYSLYDDEKIAEMHLLEKIGNQSELKTAITNVKNYFYNTLGKMALSEKGMLGTNTVFDTYVSVMEDGFNAWSDVLADCEEFVDKLEKE
jgi:hypothetical protein